MSAPPASARRAHQGSPSVRAPFLAAPGVRFVRGAARVCVRSSSHGGQDRQPHARRARCQAHAEHLYRRVRRQAAESRKGALMRSSSRLLQRPGCLCQRPRTRLQRAAQTSVWACSRCRVSERAQPLLVTAPPRQAQATARSSHAVCGTARASYSRQRSALGRPPVQTAAFAACCLRACAYSEQFCTTACCPFAAPHNTHIPTASVLASHEPCTVHDPAGALRLPQRWSLARGTLAAPHARRCWSS